MKYYIKKMIEEYPYLIKPSKCLQNDQLFKINSDSPAVSQKNQEVFYSTVI